MSSKMRHGMAIIEVVAACGVLLGLMAVVAGVFAMTQHGRLAAARHNWALTEASNCLERLSAAPWDDLTPQRAAAEALSPSAREVLGPTATMVTKIEDIAAEPASRKIDVEIHWTNDGRPAPGVRLTTWRYRLPRVPCPCMSRIRYKVTAMVPRNPQGHHRMGMESTRTLRLQTMYT